MAFKTCLFWTWRHFRRHLFFIRYFLSIRHVTTSTVHCSTVSSPVRLLLLDLVLVKTYSRSFLQLCSWVLTFFHCWSWRSITITWLWVLVLRCLEWISPLGNPQWRALGKFQIKRIEERDHMVIYLSAMGTSHPYKYVEESADGCLYRYTRKGQHDLIVKKTIKADLATFHD